MESDLLDPPAPSTNYR